MRFHTPITACNSMFIQEFLDLDEMIGEMQKIEEERMKKDTEEYDNFYNNLDGM